MAEGSFYESIRLWEKRCLAGPCSLYPQRAQPLDPQCVHELEELEQISSCVFRGGVVVSSYKLHLSVNSDYHPDIENLQHA